MTQTQRNEIIWITTVNIMNEQEKILLLELLMEDIRGNWNDPWERISIIRSLCDEIMTVPSALLGAIKKNADTFDGHFNDGRIFRDGQMFLPEGAVEGFGFPEIGRAHV